MIYRVQLSELAIDDLIALHRWITSEADAETATGYIDRIEARIAALSEFPNRGTPRDDLSDRLRTLAFERRLIIAYKINDETVTVLRVINAARDLGSDFTH
ncbi:MAG: type II toxin-antitoxin system RelE/ParE family toxin [Sphingomonadaceae bacterium]